MLPRFPALSDTVQVTDLGPTLDVSSAPHNGEPTTPDRLSVALLVTIAAPFKTTGFGLTEAVTAGSVLSYLKAAEAVVADGLPALSVQVPETVSPLPSGPA